MVPIHPTGHRLTGTNNKCHCQLDVTREVLVLYPRTTSKILWLVISRRSSRAQTVLGRR